MKIQNHTLKQVSPILVVLLCFTIALVSAVIAVTLAANQPWIGLSFSNASGPGLRVDKIHQRTTIPNEINPGARVTSLRRAGEAEAENFNLRPLDKLDEPDTLVEPDLFNRFFARQDAIYVILSSGPVTLTFTDMDESPRQEKTVTFTPAAFRPLGDLPPVFWVQIVVGIVGMTLGGWILALRRNDRAVQFFMLAGIGLMISAHSAGVYSTRELAISASLFGTLSWLNFTGTLMFGMGMINLFLVYPTKLASQKTQFLVILLLCIPLAAAHLGWPQFFLNRQISIATAMLLLVFVIAVQVSINRTNPLARAMLGWFGLSVIVGAGGFGLTVTLPILLGGTPTLEQGYAFLYFLTIYAGLAISISKYSLFDLSNWSFRILFYILGVALLLILDALLILALSLDRAAALGISIALVGIIYLPLRDTISRWLNRGKFLTQEELFSLITEITLAPSDVARGEALRTTLIKLFDPIKIEQLDYTPKEIQLVDRGEGLEIPMPHNIPCTRLTWARQGRRLFSRADCRLAESLFQMLDRAISQQKEYELAVEMERSRINRDMHDNIGIQLLGALHSTDTNRKNTLIRHTLADLRQIISNPLSEPIRLSPLLLQLRSEVTDHANAAGIDVLWDDHRINREPYSNMACNTHLMQTIKALTREGTSNVIRHSGAKKMSVCFTIHTEPEALSSRYFLKVTINDEGQNSEEGQETQQPITAMGSGLKNLQFRIAKCGGNFDVNISEKGSALTASIPINPFGDSKASKSSVTN